LFKATGKCPLIFPEFHFVHTPMSPRKKLNSLRYPCNHHLRQRMATARVLHHLKSGFPDPRKPVLFVGFSQNGTRGQILKMGLERSRSMEKMVPVRAQVRLIDSFFSSRGHVGDHALAERLSVLRQRTYVVHGEPETSAALARISARHSGGKSEFRTISTWLNWK